MKFGVIVCHSCQRASGVNLQYKTTSCPYCGKNLKLNPKRIKHQSNSEKDLKNIISTINKELGFTQGPNQGSPVSDFGIELLKMSDSEQDIDHTQDKKPVYEKLDPYQRIAMKHKEKKNSIEFIVELTKDLALELGEFHTHDFRQILSACNLDVNKADEYLEQLKNSNIIYEPRLGVFKILND
jgi:predicted transcriptional regulator